MTAKGNAYGRKDAYFDFERIKILFEEEPGDRFLQKLSDQECHDLDFDQIFMTLDCTVSSPGQQLLYSYLRTLPVDSSRSGQLEQSVSEIVSDESQISKLQKVLSNLSGPGAYYLVRVFTRPQLATPKWAFILPLLSFATLLLLAGSFFSKGLLLPLLLMILVNSFFHYWNKGNVISYSNALPQLNQLRSAARKIHRSGYPNKNAPEISKDLVAISRISKLSALLQIDNENGNEFAQIANYLFDLVKIVFVLEPILIFRITRLLEKKKESVRRLYYYIARIDLAISIIHLRKKLNYYCIPAFSGQFKTEEIYHPLISDPVVNDLILGQEDNILLAGSNMSGKTTFIRTVGVNTLLAQTLNTACAKAWSTPRYKIHTAIRITDDLLQDESYYYREVKIVKAMLEQSQDEVPHLFLLDELFKGTNTRERVASSTGVLEYLASGNNKVMIATHDQELTDLLKGKYQLYHFDDQVEGDKLVFDYKLKKGRLRRTNAIRILEVHNYPVEVVNRALSVAKTKD